MQSTINQNGRDGDSRLTRADKGEKRIPSDGPEQWA
jgi:hypothetical protein